MLKEVMDPNTKSLYREKITTYIFLGELMKALGNRDLTLEIGNLGTGDTFGYDIILRTNKITYFVQLKTIEHPDKSPIPNIHQTLIENKNGLLIVLYPKFNVLGSNFELMYKHWDRSKMKNLYSAKDKRNINISHLTEFKTIEELADDLFVHLKRSELEKLDVQYSHIDYMI